MKHAHPLLLAASALTLLISACSEPADIRTTELVPQFGTALDDRADAVATDLQRGAVYVAGVDSMDPEFYPEEGGNVFLRRYSRSGSLVWQKRLDFRAPYDPRVNGLYTDASGNIYVGLHEFSTDGFLQAALLKFDPLGRQLYRVDIDNGIRDFEVDVKGNAYIAGIAERDGAVDLQYVRKYNAQGVLMWGKARVYDESGDLTAGAQVPVPSEVSPAADGSLYVRGYLDGNLLTKYSSGGRVLWQRSLPERFYNSLLSASGNDVLLTSRRYGVDPSGNVMVRKYDASGRLVLDRTLPGTEAVSANALRLDKSGNIYLVGAVTRDDNSDFFVRKYTPSLGTTWTYAPRLAGTSDVTTEVSLQDGRSVFVSGSTTAKVNGKNYGGQDAFLLHLNPQGQKVWSR